MPSVSKAFRASSGWTDGERAFADGGMGYAVTTATGNDLVLYSLDLSEIPADCTVDGISVRIDAYKEETSGSGTLWVAAELSWNGGSSYTSTSRKTPNLTTSEVTTTLGGAADGWSRSWTRSELDSLRLRLSSGSSAVLDTPDWRVDYAIVTIFYSETTALYGTWSETLSVADNYSPSRVYAGFEESVTVRDGRETLRSPDAAIAGDVLDDLQALPANWQSATTARNADTCMYVEITFAPGWTLIVSDNTNADPAAQEGILEWDAISLEGAAGVDTYGAETGFVIRNAVYTIGSVSYDIATWIRSFKTIGGTASIYAQALYSGTYLRRLLFSGTITSVKVGEFSTEFRISQEDKENLPVPQITISPTLFDYGTDEGTMPKNATDRVVPVAFGRFDPSALRTGWPAANPLSLQNQGAIIGAAMGLKFPMVPLPVVADRYRIRSGLNPGFPVTATQTLFGFGDTAAGIAMSNTPSAGAVSEAAFQMSEIFSSSRIPVHMFTWDSSRDRANPFVHDYMAYAPEFNSEIARSGAGQLGPPLSPPTSAAIGTRIQGFYVTRTSPVFAAPFNWSWPLASQSAWLSPSGFNQYGGSPFSGASGTPTSWFTTPAIANVRNVLTSDLDSYVTVAAGQQLGLHFPSDPAPSGEITGIRLWIIYNGAQSGHTASVWARKGWDDPRTFRLDLNVAYIAAFPAPPAAGIGLGNTPAAGGALNAAVGWHNSSIDGNWYLTSTRFAVGQAAGDKFPYESEVLITVGSGSLKIAHVFMEVQFRAPLAFDQVRNIKGQVIYKGESPNLWNRLFHGKRSVKAAKWDVVQPGIQRRIEPVDESTVFITGRSKVDTTPKTYTGTDGSLIEVAPDIGQVVVDVMAGDYVNVVRGSAFGSFETARTILNAKLGGDLWALSPIIDQQSDVQETLDQLGQNSMSFCRRQASDTGTLVWRWFVDGPAPQTDDPNRIYRSGFLFDGDTILRDSLVVSTGDVSDMFSEYTIKWGLHQPSGEFAGTMFVNKDGDNLVSSGSAYRAKCAAVTTGFGINRAFVVEAPWVWREKIADKLLKWHVDSRRSRRHLVEFSTGPNGLDIQPGHVIRFADSVSTWLKYPGQAAGSNWEAINWVVVNVSIETEPLAPIRVRVSAIETYVE